VARRALARHTRLAALVGWAVRASGVDATRAFAKSLHASAATEKLSRLARQDAGALEALAEGCLAFEVTGREVILPAAFCKLLLVVEQVHLVDRDATLAPLRLAARLDDSTGLVLFAGPMGGRDLNALRARLRLLAANEQDAEHSHPAE
jgi:hypothetical protein